MDSEADSSLEAIDSVSTLEKNHLKESQLDNGEDRRSQIESDEEDGDYSPLSSDKLSRNITCSEGRPLVYVYTYKVSLIFSFTIFFPFIVIFQFLRKRTNEEN